MGGHQGGEVAARLAVEVLERETDDLDRAVARHRRRTPPTPRSTSSPIVDPTCAAWAPRLCAIALVPGDDGEDELAVVNVGDSRLYLLRDGDLVQVTRDHSLVEDMRASGQITEAEAAGAPAAQHRHPRAGHRLRPSRSTSSSSCRAPATATSSAPTACSTR